MALDAKGETQMIDATNLITIKDEAYGQRPGVHIYNGSALVGRAYRFPARNSFGAYWGAYSHGQHFERRTLAEVLTSIHIKMEGAA